MSFFGLFLVISLSFYTFAAKRIYNIGIYGNTVQKAPNVYFPSEDGSLLMIWNIP